MDGEQRAEVTVGSLAFTAILWLLAGYLAFGAISFSFEARIAPLLFGGVGFVFLTYLLIRDLTRFLGRGADQRAASRSVTASSESVPEDATPVADEVSALVWTIGAVVLLVVFGFVIGMSVAVFAIVWVYARERVGTAVALTVGVMGVLYFVFGQLLNTSLYPGLLELLG